MNRNYSKRLCCLVALLAACAYGAALLGEYVFDDIHSVSANPAVHSLSNLGEFWTDPSMFSAGPGRMYRPALLTSFALNLAISPAAWSLKLGNVLIHASVASLLFAWLWRLTRRARGAFVVSAVFAVHPLASEAINLVSARSELLLAFGVVLALFANVSWQRARGKFLPMLGMLLGTVLACGSKETGVLIPGLLLVQSYCLRHRRPDASDWCRAAKGIVPVVALVIGYLVVRKLLLGQATINLLDRTGEDPSSGHGRTLLMQLATMGTLLPRMLWQMVAPVSLSLDPVVVYRDSFLDPVVMLGWGFIVTLTVIGLWPSANARVRRIGTAVAWAMALPWIVVPLNVPFAEHRFYGPMVGLVAVAVSCLPRVARCGAHQALSKLRAALALLLLLGVAGSVQRSLLYQDERDLWRAEIAQNAQSFRGWWGLGACQMRHSLPALAIEPLQRAHELYPLHHDAQRNLVEALVALPDDQAQPERTLAAGQALLERSPEDPWVRTLVVQANLQAGRLGLGEQHYVDAERIALSCLEIAKPKGYVYQLAAYARHGLGDVHGALAHLDTSLARGLNSVDVRMDRARLLHELGRTKEARAVIFELQREYPTDLRIVGALRYFTSAASSRDGTGRDGTATNGTATNGTGPAAKPPK